MDYRILLITISVVGLNEAYPFGPPMSACADMTPQHGYTPKADPSPYKIKLSKTCFSYGNSIEVTITSDTPGTKFKGFFVQARPDMMMNKAYGMFSITDIGHKVLSCFNGNSNAVGHSWNSDKESATFMWRAGMMNVTTVHFNATIVQAKDTYWVGVTSAAVRFDPNCPRPPIMAAGQVQTYSVLLMAITFVVSFWN